MMAVIIWRLTGFRWSVTALTFLGPVILVLGMTFACTRFLPEIWSLSLGLTMTATASVASVLALQKLLGVNLWQTVRRKFQTGSA
jgi:hypothetical protein